jgi:hypothetical protein
MISQKFQVLDIRTLLQISPDGAVFDKLEVSEIITLMFSGGIMLC